MSWSTRQAFDRLLEGITPTGPQLEQLSRNLQKTQSYLETAFSDSSTMPVERVALIGSASRGTAITPIETIDVMAQFVNKNNAYERYRENSRIFLQGVARMLSAKTWVAKVRDQGQAIRVPYADGPSVDLTPVFKMNESGYALPAS